MLAAGRRPVATQSTVDEGGGWEVVCFCELHMDNCQHAVPRRCTKRNCCKLSYHVFPSRIVFTMAKMRTSQYSMMNMALWAFLKHAP